MTTINNMFHRFSVACCLLATWGWGQTTIEDPLSGQDNFELTNERADSIGAYEKPMIYPGPPDEISLETDGIKFETANPGAETASQLPEPKPVKDTPKPEEQLYPHLFRAGYGRFGTPLIELLLNSNRNPGFTWNVEARHFQSFNGHVDYAEFRDDFLRIQGIRHLDKFEAGGFAGFFNTDYYYYGDTILQQRPEFQDSLKYGFSKLWADAFIRSREGEDVHYQVTTEYRGVFDLPGNSEHQFGLVGQVQWPVSTSLYADLGAEGRFSSASFTDYSGSRTLLKLSPGIVWKQGSLQVASGLTVQSYADSTSRLLVLPWADVQYTANEQVRLFASYEPGIQWRSFYDLIQTNKFLWPEAPIQSGVQHINLESGVALQPLEGLSLTIMGFFRSMNGQVVFFNPYQSASFGAYYDSSFSWGGGSLQVAYSWRNMFRSGLTVEYNAWPSSDSMVYFQYPPFSAILYGEVTIQEKVTIGTKVYILGSRPMTYRPDGRLEEEGTIADVNLYADYRFAKRFSVFLAVNNLLNNTYQRWYGFVERPLDVRAGLTVSF